MRARRLRLLALAVCLGGVATACRSAAPGAPTIPLRVLTFNIHAGHGDLGRVASTACTAGADVIALQEVDVHWAERSDFADQAAALAAACGMDVRFAPIYSLPPLEPGRPPRQFGVAVLSRHPIVSWRNHPLTRLSTQDSAVAQPMPGFLQVTIESGETSIDIFDTHLDYRPDPSVRRIQVSEMLAIMGESGRPAILMGDMNAPPEREELAPLFRRLRDAWIVASGPGYTYPAEEPARRIDYIFLTGRVRALSARVLATDASDHLPVIAELEIERG